MNKKMFPSSTWKSDAELFRREINGLKKKFGPQGWWPRLVRRGRKVEVKHHPGERSRWLLKKAEERAFEVAVGAILTQNTAWTNVEKALLCLANKHFLTSSAIAQARASTIASCVRSSGYFRQKAKKLKDFARFVERELGGDLRHLAKLDAPRELLLKQWGIGPETADTILLYGLNLPYFVVDAYTRRLLASLIGSERWRVCPYDEARAFCSGSIPQSVAAWQEAHALIVAWGKETRNSRS